MSISNSELLKNLFLYFLVINFGGIEARYVFRILGGSECYLGEYPSQVSLAKDESHACGGSLVTSKAILSAAHCFEGANRAPAQWSVMAGDISVSEDGSPTRQIRNVSFIFVHPKYDPKNSSYAHDIALLQVDKPFQVSTIVHPINITNREEKVPPGTSCAIVGWGVNFHVDEDDFNYYDIPYKLLSTKIKVFPDSTCIEKYLGLYRPNEMICAGDMHGHKDACQGDSGGPLICNDVLSGVVSFGVGCGVKDIPGVYTNVVQMKDWISDTLSRMDFKNISLRSDTATSLSFQTIPVLSATILVWEMTAFFD